MSGLQNLVLDVAGSGGGGGRGGGYGERDIMRETHFKAPVSSMFLVTFHSYVSMSIFRTSITRCNHTDNEQPIIIQVHPDTPLRCLNKRKYDHGLSRRSCNGSQSNECGLFSGHCNGLQSKCKADSRGIITVHKVSLRPIQWVL